MASQGWKEWKPEYNGALLETRPAEPYIETYTGEKFYFLNPTPDMIHIEDIAHALANQCRFTGHSSKFYSVAEHSIYVSKLCGNSIAGLLHDASEAYLTDVASPVKPFLHNYKTLEDKLMKAIATKFNFPYPFVEEVHIADKIQLLMEARHLIRSEGTDWATYDPDLAYRGIQPKCLVPQLAEGYFLEQFKGIM
ncbi:MAG: hypothetical protein KGI08_07060 [Thaumarchaeota archaeon]|nr:hypothetical protein [Nitrososphaerota archaeon]